VLEGNLGAELVGQFELQTANIGIDEALEFAEQILADDRHGRVPVDDALQIGHRRQDVQQCVAGWRQAGIGDGRRVQVEGGVRRQSLALEDRVQVGLEILRKAERLVPQMIAGGDIYPALEKGTIDAAEWVGPYDDEKLGFQKVAKYYYYPGFWEGGPTVHAYANLEKWNELPKSYQAVLANAAQATNSWMAARYDMQNPGALKRLVAGGTQLRPFTNEVLEACLKATNELWAEISAKNADFKKSIDSMQAYRSDQYLWWQVAEYTFDSFMIRSRTRG